MAAQKKMTSPNKTPIKTLPEDQFPVVIIGAGLAGLAAGAHLAGREVPPLLLEADSLWPGGRLGGGDAEVLHHEGRDWSFTPDHGVHAMWGGYVNMHATLERFTETTWQFSTGEEWINRWGKHVRRMEAGNAIRAKYIPAPFHYLQLLFNPLIWANIAPWDFLSLPGLLLSILLTIGIDPIKEERPMDGLDMSLFFRGWTPNLRATFTGLAVNLLAASEEDIDLASWIAALRFYTMLRRDAWIMRYFPSDSHVSLVQPLRDHIEQAGGELLDGMTVQHLERTPEGWRVVAEAGTGEVRSFYAQHVIIATNGSSAERFLLKSADTAPQAQGMIFPESLSNAVIRLWFKRAPHQDYTGGMLTGDFLPDNFFWLHRLYDDFRQWHEATGGSAIEMHVYGPKAVLDLPDANLMVEGTTEVLRAWPELKGQFLYGTVQRNIGVQTRFRVPDAHTLGVITPWEDVFACGDWVRHETPSMWMERSTTTGIAAANEVLTAYGLEPYPLLFPPQPELLVRILNRVIGWGRRLLGGPIRRLARLRRQEGDHS